MNVLEIETGKGRQNQVSKSPSSSTPIGHPPRAALRIERDLDHGRPFAMVDAVVVIFIVIVDVIIVVGSGGGWWVSVRQRWRG